MSIFDSLHDFHEIPQLKDLLAENNKVLKEMSATLIALNKSVQTLNATLQKQNKPS